MAKSSSNDAARSTPKRRMTAKLVRSALANAQERNDRDHAGIDVDNLVDGTLGVYQRVAGH